MQLKKIGKVILIFSTQRSGSTMVTSDFAETNILGKPKEYFTEKILPSSKFDNCTLSVAEIKSEIESILQRAKTENGVLAIKIMSDYVLEIARAIEKIGVGTQPNNFEGHERKAYLHKLFINFFNNLDVDGQFTAFRVYRQDKVKQAISSFVAARTGLYHVWKNEAGQLINHYDRPQEKATPFSLDVDKHYDRERISTIIRSLYQQERELDILLENFEIRPTNLVYESIVSDTKYLQSVVENIDYLNNSELIEEIPRKTVKTASPLNQELIQKFNSDKGFEGNTECILSEPDNFLQHIPSLPKKVAVNRSCFLNRDIVDLSIGEPYLKANDRDLLVIEGAIVSRHLIERIFVSTADSDKQYEAETNFNSEYFGSIYWAINRSDKARFRCLVPLSSQATKDDSLPSLELNYQIAQSAAVKLAEIDISRFVGIHQTL